MRIKGFYFLQTSFLRLDCGTLQKFRGILIEFDKNRKLTKKQLYRKNDVIKKHISKKMAVRKNSGASQPSYY